MTVGVLVGVVVTVVVVGTVVVTLGAETVVEGAFTDGADTETDGTFTVGALTDTLGTFTVGEFTDTSGTFTVGALTDTSLRTCSLAGNTRSPSRNAGVNAQAIPAAPVRSPLTGHGMQPEAPAPSVYMLLGHLMHVVDP